MAFKLEHFALIGPDSNGNAGRHWAYKSDDVHAVIDTAAYFNDVADLLTVGDVINVVVVTNLDASNEAVATYGPHIVLSNASGVVDVSDVTIGVMTDTD